MKILKVIRTNSGYERFTLVVPNNFDSTDEDAIDELIERTELQPDKVDGSGYIEEVEMAAETTDAAIDLICIEQLMGQITEEWIQNIFGAYGTDILLEALSRYRDEIQQEDAADTRIAAASTEKA